MLKLFKKVNSFKLWIWTFFLVTVMLGVSFRSVELLSNNYLFGFDQGRDYLAVKSIVEDKKITLIGSEIGAGTAGFRGIFHGPFHYYLLSVPYIIFDGNPYGGMVLTYLYGIITIILLFVIGKKLYGNMGGLFAAGLAAISAPLISQSRFIWNSHGAPVFVLLTFYFVYKLCQQVRYRYLFLASFFAAFIYNFQIAIAVPMSISLVILAIIILRIRDVKKYAAIVLGFVFGFSPMILFELRHDFMAVSGIIDYISGSDHIGGLGFIITMLDHLPSFTHNIYDAFIKQDLLKGEVIGVFLFVFSLFFIFKEKNKAIKRFVIYLLILPFITFLVLGLLNNIVWIHYLLHLGIVYILIFTYIFFSSYLQKKYFLTVLLMLFLSISLLKLSPALIKNIISDFYDYGGTQKMKGKTDVIDFIYRDSKGENFGIFVFTPPVYAYPYEYLIHWYGVTKYGQKPIESKDGLFYLLIEVDPYKPWSYKGWIETVIVEGDTIFEKKLLNGFIVQKRKNNL